MAIRICLDGREYQRLEMRATMASLPWFVHSVDQSGEAEVRRFGDYRDNFETALQYAEARAQCRPAGDIWLVDDPHWHPVRFGLFEPNSVASAAPDTHDTIAARLG